MPTPETLRLRLQLVAKFDQVAERLRHGNVAALEEAQDHLYGLALAADSGTMALVFQALARVLDGFQGQIDAEGWQYSLDDSA